MKYSIIFLMMLFLVGPISFSQEGVGVNTNTPDPSAILDVESTEKGFLPPRLASDADVASPAAGLVIYDISDDCLNVFDGDAWVNLCGGDGSDGGSTPIVLPPSIRFAENENHFIASAYDEDYLPYTPPTTPGTTATLSPGTNEATIVDVQGTLDVTGLTIQIPVTTTGTGIIPAFSQTVTVPANLTENSTPTEITLSWNSQSYDQSTQAITANLKAVTNELLVKKLDINAGLGNDNLGVLIAQFSFPSNSSGDMTSFNFRALPGIPDRNFGNGTHDFLYYPVTGNDGETWLNYNLGANYSNLNHSSFNPVFQPEFPSADPNATGSYFQWGRYSDGHELSGSQSVSATSSTTLVSGANSDKFFTGTDELWYNGTSPDYKGFWQGVDGLNNPCPVGYRVPTIIELTDEANSWTPSRGINDGINTPFKPTITGLRNNATGLLQSTARITGYWSSNPHPRIDFNGISFIQFSSGVANMAAETFPRTGVPVRCIKN